MIRVKKRRKSGRYNGSQTHKRGHRKRTRGSGNRGGKGMAGTGKRGDQKKTFVIKATGGGNTYFGKSKTLRRGKSVPNLQAINLWELSSRIQSLIKTGKAKLVSGVYEISLPDKKILGDGELEFKTKITAGGASKSAIAAIEAAGGKIIIPSFEARAVKPIEHRDLSVKKEPVVKKK